MKNSKKIYFGLLLIIVFLISTMYFSYAFFTSINEEHGKLNIVAGTLDYKIESKDLENNQITVLANSMKKVTLDLKSLNKISSKYGLYYQAENLDNLIIGYGDINNQISGVIEANENKKIEIFIRNTSSENKILTLGIGGSLLNDEINFESNDKVDYENLCTENTEYRFEYIQNSENFITPCNGNYKVELWGAGSTNGTDIAYGSYTQGTIALKNEELYIYTGGQGNRKYGTNIDNIFNGGGTGNFTCAELEGIGAHSDFGGGATDIRLINDEWYHFESLKSRLMVAGASGGFGGIHAVPSPGGGLYSENGSFYGSEEYAGTGSGQIYAGLVKGKFGQGGTATYGGAACYYNEGGGGGSGYYGGGGSSTGNNGGQAAAGAGGSSFISGHNGCDAIKEESTEDNIIHTGQSKHYSGYMFVDTVMIDGNGYNWTTEKGEYVGMPTHDGNSTMIGNSGNGYAKITYLGKSTNIDDLIHYELESDDLKNNQITLAANTMKKVTVDINNLSKISSNYELYYTTDNQNDLIVGYGDQNNETTGVIGTNSKKTVDIYIRNTSDKSKTINFNIKGNLQDKDIMLDETEKTINNLCTVNKEYNFDYIKNEENFVAPCTGKYKLEVWGAQGGSNINVIGGYGGYSVGNTNLSKDEILYTNIGGSGLGSYKDLNGIDYNMALHLDGGYNGGGIGTAGICTNIRYASSGGGATHISKVSGLLSTLENSKDKILLVAGGGGGSFEFSPTSYGTYGNGSSAGGYIGNTATFTNVTHTQTKYATGGTQTSGGTCGTSFTENGHPEVGKFGQGVGYKSTGTCTEVSGGGGGYYGGGLGSWAPGAGGSGYIGNTLLTDKVMYCYECSESEEDSTKTISTTNVSEDAISNYAKKGNGYAKITYLGKEE